MNRPLDETDLRRRLRAAAALLPEPDRDLPAPLGALERRGRGRRRSITAVVAATAVAAAAAVVAALLVGSRHHDATPPGVPDRARTTCRTTEHVDVGTAPDVTVLRTRIAALGGRDISVTPDGQQVYLAASGIGSRELALACSGVTLAARPVIAAGLQGGSGTVAKPLATLPFRVPRTEAQYQSLSPAHRIALRHALGRYDCDSTPTLDTESTVVCDTDNPPYAYLVGPALFTDTDVTGASAQPPDAQRGQTEWTVRVRLSPAARSRWSAYTAAHNVGGSSSVGDLKGCDPASVPCADFVAIVVDGRAVAIPLTETRIDGDTSIAAAFTQSSATALAAQLHGPLLPRLQPVLATSTTPPGDPTTGTTVSSRSSVVAPPAASHS